MRVQLITNAHFKIIKIYNKIINLLVYQMGPPYNRFIASSLHRFIASSLHRFIASSLHRFIA
ncbi:hypothetical protein, partial [uncultured Ruegeria sp.]|uniref:hypothetical protein n=1 Tax=uncultured Ruegeria sp. TaxID=259304 RepID=UPI002638ABAA